MFKQWNIFSAVKNEVMASRGRWTSEVEAGLVYEIQAWVLIAHLKKTDRTKRSTGSSFHIWVLLGDWPRRDLVFSSDCASGPQPRNAGTILDHLSGKYGLRAPDG